MTFMYEVKEMVDLLDHDGGHGGRVHVGVGVDVLKVLDSFDALMVTKIIYFFLNFKLNISRLLMSVIKMLKDVF